VGTLLWDDPFLWIEDCSVEEIVLWDEGSNRVMIFGDVLATEQECKKIYTKYREKQNLSVWAKLAGNTTTILYEDNKTTFIPDPCQLRPIFYVVENNCILVSTSRLGIKRMLSVSIDKKSVAMSLMCAGMTELSHHFSLLNKVKIIPSHHAMIVTSSGVELIPVRFSCKEEKTLKEGASELRQKLVSSTKRRLNRYPHQSCDFSGGLDSTSLALLAARYSSHKVDSITFSSISEEEDVKIALKSLEDQSNIRHHLFKSSELPLPYHRLNEAPLLDEPLSFLFMWSQIEKGLKCAKSVSSDLHLTGDGGDNVLQSSDVYVSSLFNWNVFPLFFSQRDRVTEFQI
jgi:asparagine synthase (glutamine-hydrolysing)